MSASAVTIEAPLPAAAGPHPAACDRLSYLRLRDPAGPSHSEDADAVIVTMPGIFGGAGSVEGTGRAIVSTAAAAGQHVEYWALDRRSNCLEDHTGIVAGRAAGDPAVAFDYYFGGGAAGGGPTFGGFETVRSTRWLARVGLAQTIRDELTVIDRLPPSYRERRVFCGGHSLGGPITAALATWDDDGNRATTADAGWRRCAGFFTLDARLPLYGDDAWRALISPLGISDALGRVSDGTPFVAAGGMPSTRVVGLLPVFALAADLRPGEQSRLLARLPRTPDVEGALRLLLSKDWVQGLFGVPDFRTLKATNQFAFAEFFDNNMTPVTILQAGLGSPGGGPLAARDFPLPFGAPVSFGLLGGSRLAAPSAYGADAPVYRWKGRDENGPALDPSGAPYSPAERELTDIGAFARSVSAGDLDFAEQYMPTRLLFDLGAYMAGDRSGSLGNLRQEHGVTRRPALYLDAAEGIGASAGPVAPGPPPTRVVTLPWYGHLDAGSAARDGADGRPLPLAPEFLGFTSDVIR